MILFGTTTSPYVRRVRIVASMLDIPLELQSTATAEGQKKLRELTPIWKVPVLLDGEQLVFDSHAIIDYLQDSAGSHALDQKLKSSIDAINQLTVIDGALDSAINVFYFRKDDSTVCTLPYLKKQEERVVAAMSWLEQQCIKGAFEQSSSFGLKEIAMVSTLDWMKFRDAYPIINHPSLCKLAKFFNVFPVFESTQAIE
ncbi:MAG: glutathione S-transferase [Myxococcales bacterium]|nr:MAG: glutathione S-transferase [Myxococcales bacterium]